MKCLACSHENIYGATVCKQCGSSLTDQVPNEVTAKPHVNVASSLPQTVSPSSEAVYENELTFLGYTSNENFNHFIRVLRRAFDFNGRSSKAEYWWALLFGVLISIFLSIISTTLWILYSLVAIIPNIAVSIRRLHDQGKSGFYLLLAFIPFLGYLILLIFFAQDGEAESNQWGDKPEK